MKNSSKALTIILGIVLLLGLSLLCGLFHGYFDHGRFEVRLVRWASPTQVAMVVERSDQQALNGYTYFVLIGDHLLSPSEIRHEYHSSSVIFAAADGCLDLRWRGPTRLVIACNGPTMTREHIDVQKGQSRGITVLYENIPGKQLP